MIQKIDSSHFSRFVISYEPPFDWLWILRFLSLHLTAGVEWIDDGHYMRTMSAEAGTGIIDVFQLSENTDNRLNVLISKSLETQSDEIFKRLQNLFDLNFQPEPALSCLGELAQQSPGLRVPGAFDNFETSIRVILGQLVSVQSANTLMRRYVQRFGKQFDSPFAKLTLITPTAPDVAVADAAELAMLIRIPVQRASAIVNLASAVAENRLNLEDTINPEETIRALESIPGVGAWTAQTIAMRILHWADAFPHGDLGVRKALRLEKRSDILAAAEKWRPWRSYATMHLWNSINAFPIR